MDPIQAAIEAIESRDPGEDFSYNQVAKEFGVVRSTLIRRHKGQTQPYAISHAILHPQQEMELVQYIQGLTERRTPPTRAMIRNFATTIAKRSVSESWVTQFLNRHTNHLTSHWQTGMDRQRHQADSEDKYTKYFTLIHQKIEEYRIKPEDIYNMDEKGFLIGITGRSKRVFSKRMWDRKEVTTSLQDGSRE